MKPTSTPNETRPYSVCHYCHVGMRIADRDYCEVCERRLAALQPGEIYQMMLAIVLQSLDAASLLVDEQCALVKVDAARRIIDRERGAIRRLFVRLSNAEAS